MITQIYGEQNLGTQNETEISIRIESLWRSYGAAHSFVRFWKGSTGSLVAWMDGLALVSAADEEDWDELVLFLTMQPDVRQVRTDGNTARLLADRWGSVPQTGQVMRLKTKAVPCSSVTGPESPRSLYPLLKQCFGESVPPLDCWYPDVSHRLRHGTCHIAVREEAGDICSSAMTVAEGERAALLGAVATRPEDRGKGYAGSCVMTLASWIQKQDKQVWISPKNELAKRLYSRLGFEICGEWGMVCHPQ